MSLYATWLSIDDDNHETRCDRWIPVAKGEPWTMVTGSNRYYRYDAERPCTCGELPPIVYQGSHVNPSDDDARGGFVMVCAIPNFCHPSALNTDDPGEKVWFLRLSVREDPSTYRGGEPGDATVVLTRKHVEELHDTLTQWLKAEDVA